MSQADGVVSGGIQGADNTAVQLTTRVAINGFGRTGRQALKAIWHYHRDVLDVAAIGLEVREADLTLYEAYNAGEAFWTTSSYCILPISMIDGRRVGDTYPGPVAGRLLERWSEKVGVDVVAQSQRFGGG